MDKINTEEALYQRLHDFDFSGNKKFMEGWKQISRTASPSELESLLQKVQVFFYSREVEKVDLTGYSHWLKKSGLPGPDVCSFTIKENDPTLSNMTEMKTVTGTDTDATADIVKETLPVNQPASISSSNNETSSNETETIKCEEKSCPTWSGVCEIDGQYPANFAELVEMLQSGMKLPGIDDVHVEPTQETPTVSVMERKLKPWETV